MILVKNTFIGQLWTLNNEMKLVNKSGQWMHQDKLWYIPTVGYASRIEDQASGNVLGLRNDTTALRIVALESKDKLITDEQTWVRGVEDVNGWFRLKNPCTGKVLSVALSSMIITGKKCFMFYTLPKRPRSSRKKSRSL